MLVTNTSGEYIYVKGYTLIPGEAVEVPNFMYLGNSDLKNQLNQLYYADKIHVIDPDEQLEFPDVDVDPLDEIPENIYIDEDSIEVQKEDVTALLGIEQVEDGDTYGIVELHNDMGALLKLKSSVATVDDAAVSFTTESSQDGKMFKYLVDGAALEIDPGTATAEDIANLLITLGLAVEAE